MTQPITQPITQAPSNLSPTGYKPESLTHITQVWPNGKVDLAIRLYLPAQSTPRTAQVKQGWWQWHTLNAPDSSNPYWHLTLSQVKPGTALRFRYQDAQRQWHTIAPLTDLERVYGTTYVPRFTYQWTHQAPHYNHGRVVLETTLESLIAGYEGGVFAPRSKEELFRNPIVRQILRTDIPNQLAALGVDEVMVTTCSSVADRSYLEPKFNYLTYDVADLDWQLGTTLDFMQLLDVLYERGVAIVPDLTLVHQVKTPFEGSLDQATGLGFTDPEAFQLRDYGTWMFNLADSHLRQQLVEKVVSFVLRYRLKTLRLGYLDGLLLQYSQREVNYGIIFLQELKTALTTHAPGTQILGESFERQCQQHVAGNIDLHYAPYGFPIAEELYKPPGERERALFPDFSPLLTGITYGINCQRRNAIYAQLHDELSENPNATLHRSRAPWAYGKNPAELAKQQGQALVAENLLPPEGLLDYVRRTVRSVESLTLFMTKLLYLYVPAVDSLVLGCSAMGDNWKFHWDDVTPAQLQFWKATGLSDPQIYLLHKQHRLDMARLRQIFRDYTIVDPNTQDPLTAIHLHHTDPTQGVLALWRTNSDRPAESLLVVFNLGSTDFKEQAYPIPVPNGFQAWEVLFDGDYFDPLLVQSQANQFRTLPLAFPPGSTLKTQHEELLLNLGSYSLIVLKAL